MPRPVIIPTLSYTVFETPIGWAAMLASSVGLRCVVLPQESPEVAIDLLLSAARPPTAQITSEPPNSPLFANAVDQLRRYFNGERIRPKAKLDFAGATDFQKRVWTAACTVPYGETRTYAWLARKAGNPKGSRAVGQALSANPAPLFVPCHRILREDSLGGFSGGMKTKRYLLRLEGISHMPQSSHSSES